MEITTEERIAIFLSEELPKVIAKALFKGKRPNFREELAHLNDQGKSKN